MLSGGYPESIASLSQKNFEHILVRATNWVGDAVMCIPALQALRNRFPQAHIAILARPSVAGIYQREPFCDEVIEYRAPKGWDGLAPKWKLGRDLSRRGFDCAILLQNAFEAGVLARLAQIPVRVGYNRDGRGWLLTHAIEPPHAGETAAHERFYYLELLKRAGFIANYDTTSSIRLSRAGAAADQGSAQFKRAGLPQRVVGVSPGAAYGGAKRWLPERFAQAALSVARQRSAAVAVFGTKEEVETCEQVRQMVSAAGLQCVSFAGSTTLAQFIELAAACDVYLTNDSGPMHIASALGTPTVAVFGATNEFATGPTGDLSRVVRQPVECSPCLLRECPIDHRCMTRVTAEQVAETALHLIESREGRA